MAESLLDKISLNKHNTILTDKWLTGQIGVIMDHLDDCNFRYVDYINNSGETCKKYFTEDDELKCPIVVCGFVGYWFHKRNELGTKDIFEGYYNLHMNKYIKAHECDDDAWDRDLNKEFACRRHIPTEKKLIKASEAIYSYITDADQKKIANIAKNYIKFARGKCKALYPSKYPENMLIEETFIDAYRIGGPAYECMYWVRTEYNLPFMGPHNFNSGKTKKESLSGRWIEHHEVEVPEYVREGFEDFDDRVLIYSNGGLMDELNENLKNCPTHDDRVRYLCTLIQPFKDFADAFYAKERIDERKSSIIEHEKWIKKWEKIDDDAVDERTCEPICPKTQIAACKKVNNNYYKDIVYWEKVQKRFFDFAQHGLTGEFTDEENQEMCMYLGSWWSLMITFAKRLASLALTYGIKLMDIQEECKVYLTWHFLITDYVDNKFISSVYHARELLKKIEGGPVEETKANKKDNNNKMKYLQRFEDYSENKELDYYLSDNNWNREINYLLYIHLSVINNGQSFGDFLNTNTHQNPVSDYGYLYGLMFNEAYRQCSIIQKSIAPETKISQFLEDAASCLFRDKGKKVKLSDGTNHEARTIPNAMDMIIAFNIMGMVHVLLSLSEEHSQKNERFLISLSVYHSKGGYYIGTHSFEQYISTYHVYVVAIINEATRLRDNYDYKSQHEYLYSKFQWYKSSYEEIKQRMAAEGKGLNSFYENKVTSNYSDKQEELSLPDNLNTMRAQTYFKKAIDKGYFKQENNKVIWVGIGNNSGDTCLAYFLGKVYGYKHSESGNIGKSIPDKALTIYFGVTCIQHLIRQAYKSQKVQKWRSKVDEFFE